MKKRYYKSKYPKRRGRIRRRGQKGGKAVKTILAILGALIGIAVLTLGAMFVLEVFFKIDTPLRPDGPIGKLASHFNAEFVVSPTPYVTPEPTPTPYPMDEFSAEDAERELVFPADFSYSYLGDPYCGGSTIVCSAGKLIDGSVRMNRLVEYNIASGRMIELPYQAENDHLFFPVFNESWLVYFDANYSVGGGNIMAVRTDTGVVSQPGLVKQVYIGQPELKLWGNYLAWTERTGSEREKVFVCDLTTMETAVVGIFDSSVYGTSQPAFGGGKLIFADADSLDPTASLIRCFDIATGEAAEYRPGVYVHDPEYNGKYFAWLSANHSEDTALYIWDGVGAPRVLEEGVVEFGLSDDFIAYGKDGAVHVYIFDSGSTYRVSPERENTHFLGVSSGTVIWMDVTSRERDIIKFSVPPVPASTH